MTDAIKAATKRERKERMDVANKTKRPARVSLTKQGKLGFPSSVKREDGKHYCWAMDDDEGNIPRYEQAYYDFALNVDGNQVRVSSGNRFDLVLMKIDEKYHQEDVERNEAAAKDARMFKETLGKGEYLPDGVMDVVTRQV